MDVRRRRPRGSPERRRIPRPCRSAVFVARRGVRFGSGRTAVRGEDVGAYGGRSRLRRATPARRFDVVKHRAHGRKVRTPSVCIAVFRARCKVGAARRSYIFREGFSRLDICRPEVGKVALPLIRAWPSPSECLPTAKVREQQVSDRALEGRESTARPRGARLRRSRTRCFIAAERLPSADYEHAQRARRDSSPGSARGAASAAIGRRGTARERFRRPSARVEARRRFWLLVTFFYSVAATPHLKPFGFTARPATRFV